MTAFKNARDGRHLRESFSGLRALREGDRGKDRLLVYELPEDSLAVGSSLGNDSVWINSKATGALERLFSLDIGQMVAGSMVVRYSTDQHGLLSHTRTGADQDATAAFCRLDARVQLEQNRSGTFRIHPAYQQRSFPLPGGLQVDETLFVPRTAKADPPIAYQILNLRNLSPEARNVRIYAYANLRGETSEDLAGEFDKSLGALACWNQSKPDWVRVFGFSRAATGYMTTHDVSRAYDPVNVLSLSNSTEATGALFGVVEVDVTLAPGAAEEVAVILAFSSKGADSARRIFSEGRGYSRALVHTVDWYREALDISQVATPEPIINQGVQWSKANMLRVMGTYPVSRAFTNEPGVSSNVVIRDMAWFVYGNDWLDAASSGEMLRAAAKMRYPSGKIAEYFNALDGHIEDYGLNINDDTPLFVLGVAHHCYASGDKAFIKDLYPVVRDAARYILTQRDKRGLVFCSAKGQNVWGIASWRNVIPNYSINGAVTEINSLCYGALKAAAQLATLAGSGEDAHSFDSEAEALRDAINTHLLNPDNGMYYQNIDADGNTHTDVTSDEVFPVMFKVAPPDVAFRIISRLNSPDFWTEAGLRVLPNQSPYYDPSSHVGLLGGVWPGVVFWYAFAAAHYHPDFMVRGLRDGYRSYLADPKKNNTVPGQFSEWFDGESLVNRGMRLSPWEPPRYMWAAIEGMAGVTIGPEGLSLDPRLPPDWKWLSLSRLPFHGREITFFVARQSEGLTLYASEAVQSSLPCNVCGENVTGQIRVWNADATVCAFRDGASVCVCLGNSAPETLIVPWDLDGLLDADKNYRVRAYNSEYGGWTDQGVSPGRDLSGLAAAIEQHGFYILNFELAD